MCELIRTAALRSAAASAPEFGLENAYVDGLAMAGTDTCPACITCGSVDVAFHPTSGSTGDGSASRYRPSHPNSMELAGFAVDQISVPRKCERLWFGYPVRCTSARRPWLKICW